MSAAIQPFFNKLWSNDARVRINAAAQLVAHLQAEQAAYMRDGLVGVGPPSASASTSKNGHVNGSTAEIPEEKDDDGEDEDMEEANVQEPPQAGPSTPFTGLADDVVYSLKRFIRALASPRDSSRLGFAVALTELLSRLDNIPSRQVISLLLSTSQLSSGVKGSEERDLLFARLFGIHALIQSGLVFREEDARAGLHDWRTLIEECLVLGERKIWLRESAGWVVQEAVKSLLKKPTLAWREEGLKTVLQAAFDTSLAEGEVQRSNKSSSTAPWTPERLALVVLLQQQAGFHIDWDKYTKQTFAKGANGVLEDKENLSTISRILKGLSSTTEGNGQASSDIFGTGQLHYVWTAILDAYFTSESTETSKQKKIKQAGSAKIPFVEFYKTAVDEASLAPNASVQSKYIGLVAFVACVSRADAQSVPSLITANFLRTVTNHLSKGDRTLHGIARQAVRSIPEAVKRHPSAGYSVLQALYTAPYGTIRFDAVTRTKTVEDIVSRLDREGIIAYKNWLFSYINEAGANDNDELPNGNDQDEESESLIAKSIDTRRTWAMDQLVLLVRKHQAQPIDSTQVFTEDANVNNSPWILQVIQFLALHGFFSLQKSSKKLPVDCSKEKPESPFSSAAQQAFRARFISCLTHLVTVSTKCSGESWVSRALATLRALEKDEKHVKPLAPSSLAAERSTALQLLQTISKKADPQRTQPLSLLVGVLLLQAYDPESEAGNNVLEQLDDAIETLLQGSGQEKEEESDSDEGEAAEPVSVLIDLLIELLSKPAVLLKTVAERVFIAFSGDVSQQAMQLLLDQIDPESAEDVDDDAQSAAASDDSEAPSEDNASEEEDDDEDGKVAVKGKGKRRAADMEESSDDDDDDDEESDDDGGIDLDVDPELRDKVAAALASAGVGINEDDASDDDEEEELLNDEQMMELDEQLAEIFRNRKAVAKQNRDQVQNSLNARLRIVDLLALYAKHQASNPLLLETVLPLFNTARQANGQEDELAAKARRVLSSIVTKPKEYPQVPAQDVQSVLTILSAVQAVARSARSHETSDLANATSLYLSRLILTPAENRHATDVCDVYCASLLDYLTRKRSRVQPKSITAFITRFRSAAWNLRDALLQACGEDTTARHAARRVQCFTLLHELITMHTSLKTDAAKRDVLDFLPQVVKMVLRVFKAAADGKGMNLQNIRLREIFKFCMQAVRATKVCLRDQERGGQKPTWEIWQVEELSNVLAKLGQSSKFKNAASLNVHSRHLINLINEGSGRALSRHVKKGLPPMLPVNEEGKPMDKLARRQVKKAEKNKQKEAKVARLAAKGLDANGKPIKKRRSE